LLLAHAQNDGTLVRDDHRVVGEDGIRVFGHLRRVVVDLTAGVAEHGGQRVVLGLGLRELRLGNVVPVLRVGIAEGFVGSANENPFQGFDHALGTVCLHF
jgi:hypothetical protein